MDMYSLLREIADSWVLLIMFVFFVAVGIWAFRPGSSKIHEDASRIPLRNDTVLRECSDDASACGRDGLEGLKDV